LNSGTAPFSSSSVSQSISYAELSAIIERLFKIQQGFVDNVHGSIPTFYIERDERTKVNFGRLRDRLDSYSLIPMLREGEEKSQYILRIFSIRNELAAQLQQPKKRKIPVQLILLVTTLVTVTIAGYFISDAWFQSFGGGSLWEILPATAAYAASLMAILTVHELGHVIVCKARGIKSTLPYFIPAPPWLGAGLYTPGTFGALIVEKSPPTNRDELFDLGIAGPLSGFIVAIIVTVIGVSLSVNLPVTGPLAGIYPPPIMYLVLSLFPGLAVPGTYISLHPVAQAGFLGLIITSLNLFPVSQLDGGHVSRAVFGVRGYRKASAVSMILLLFLALISVFFLPFAILILLFSFAGGHPGPLDDVSKIRKGRKLIMVLGFVVLFLSLPMEYLKLIFPS